MLAELIRNIEVGLDMYVKERQSSFFRPVDSSVQDYVSIAQVESNKHISKKRKNQIIEVLLACTDAEQKDKTPKQLAHEILQLVNGFKKWGCVRDFSSRLRQILINAIYLYYSDLLIINGSNVMPNLAALAIKPKDLGGAASTDQGSASDFSPRSMTSRNDMPRDGDGENSTTKLGSDTKIALKDERQMARTQFTTAIALKARLAVLKLQQQENVSLLRASIEQGDRGSEKEQRTSMLQQRTGM